MLLATALLEAGHASRHVSTAWPSAQPRPPKGLRPTALFPPALERRLHQLHDLLLHHGALETLHLSDEAKEHALKRLLTCAVEQDQGRQPLYLM